NRQTLTDADLVAFGRRFGELIVSPALGDPRVAAGSVARQGGGPEAFPQVTVVSNIVENDVALGGLGDSEVIWHTDMSSYDAPPNQTILYALEVPGAGGATSFCDMYRALDTLPDTLRRRIDGLSMKHDAIIDAAGFVRPRFAHLVDADPEDMPGAVHPLICTHPDTGRDCLYLGRRSNARLLGVSRAESDELLAELWERATQPALTWTHTWQRGDLLMWDNRCVMHRREPFDPSARRLMHRVVVEGTAPYRAAA
ncbi:MAG: TauD/TfdA family dioxygenase, partial [Alphaproteobacteria bacterium]